MVRGGRDLKGFDGAGAALRALEYEPPEAAAAIKAEID